jgi:hypothetical protein
MAETIKSVLLVDYDSIHRSVAASDPAAAERLASRAVAWVDAIESGALFAAKSSAEGQRRVLVRRCYADPGLLGDGRKAFLSGGFQIVDCPPIEGREHNAAAINMVLDTIDALEHPTGYEEFILLSAESDLSPVLVRLKANNRTTSIYANAATAEDYKAIADSIVDEDRFVAVLLSDDEPASDERPAATVPPASRSDVEALARKVSSATSVPLFAPRTFAELFRSLVDEIAESGYHFQTTAENVATRMTAAGRDVTRRQVVFVVKGLALKGHVFSTDDTAERLAEVFCEQALYLCENAGVELDEKERWVLSSWIVGSPPSASANGSQESDQTLDEAIAESPAEDTPEKPAAKPTSAKASRSPKKKQPAATKSEPVAPPPQKPTREAAKPAPEAPQAAKKPPEDPAPPAPAAAKNSASAPAPAQEPSPAKETKAEPPPKPASGTTTSASEQATVESSILAAIAEAVDVLVEDSDAKPKAAAKPAAAPREKKPAAKPAPEDVEESDEIGDEIQRIIASYSRNRD